PSSCTECHLSGVELKDYIRPSQEQTFAALVEAGLVDVERPAASKILTFINRRPDSPSLISEKVRQEEHAAFQAWIEAAVKDPKLLAAKSNDVELGPAVSDEVIRHARTDRVLQSFIDNVWSEVLRCAACHSPDRNQKQVKQHGEQVSWIKLRDPKGTMEHLIDSGLIDTDAPEASLILQKPTMQVEHVGGQKMLIGDRTYKQFLRFIDDYAAVVNDEYRSAGQLPKPSAEVSVATEIWLKIEDVPKRFDKMLMRVDVYRWQEDAKRWSDQPWASSDRAVFGKGRLWQHSLSLISPRGSNRAAEIRRTHSLPPGRYLAKISVDQSGRLKQDPNAELTAEDLVAEVELESRWPTGYQRMTVIRFPAGSSQSRPVTP
ncbi:MAG: hypothetical protein ACREJB_04280, partial [Planctomycetaceae bacterium]